MADKKFFLGLLVLTFMITGCASGVSRTQISPKGKFECSSNNPVGNMELTLTAEGKADLSENLKFNPDELKAHIQRALSASSLIDPSRNADLPSLLVEIKDIRVRSNFSAVMWGFMAGNDHIIGDIAIKDKDGTEVDRFEVSASYALGGFAGGQDSARMSWLYETFSEEIIKELTNGNTMLNQAVVSNVKIEELKQGDVVLVEFRDGNERKINVAYVGRDHFNGDFRSSAGAVSSRTFGKDEIEKITILSRSK